MKKKKKITKKLFVNEIELKDIISSEEIKIDEEKIIKKSNYDFCRTMTIMSDLRNTNASYN